MRRLYPEEIRQMQGVLDVRDQVAAIRLAIAQAVAEKSFNILRVPVAKGVMNPGQRAMEVPSAQVFDLGARAVAGALIGIIPEYPQYLGDKLALNKGKHPQLELRVSGGCEAWVIIAETVMDGAAVERPDPGHVAFFQVDQVLPVRRAVINHDVIPPGAIRIDLRHKAVGLHPIERGIRIQLRGQYFQAIGQYGFIDA